MLWFIIFAMLLKEAVSKGNSPEIISRKDWGSTVPLPTEWLTLPIPKVFFHHTAGPEYHTNDQCIDIIKSIQTYHINIGFADIGYNIIIGGDGNIYEGRGWDKVGAHTRGHNRDSISIVFIGDYTSKDPTPEMLTKAENLIECGVKQGYISPLYGLYDHRDGSCSEGPGEHFYNTLQTEWPHWRANGKLVRKC